ncbi:MAG: hypothetical protein EOP09_20840 [Proteobacteria bacterium]|nr:MAG: hypothetical protein EOP09_20840 [Pseudomonadota bacterium]
MSALKTKPNARTLLALATFVAGIALTGCGKSNGGNAAGTVINPLRRTSSEASFPASASKSVPSASVVVKSQACTADQAPTAQSR